jgi:hypothetical protein
MLYFVRFRTVPESCYPYEEAAGYEDKDSTSNICRIPKSSHFNVVKALGSCDAILKRKAMFRTQPAYKVGRRNTNDFPRRREMDIMFEIQKHGPVQGLTESKDLNEDSVVFNLALISAMMEVFSDFFHYKSGVYQKTNLANPNESGFHSVKIIGWGEENGIPYWVCYYLNFGGRLVGHLNTVFKCQTIEKFKFVERPNTAYALL